jgi:hypothetical protein
METALSYLTVLPLTKEERKHFVSKAKSEILAGNDDPLRIVAVLKGIGETIKALQDDKEIKSYVLKEANKYNEKSFEHAGVKFGVSSRRTWNYDGCNYNRYNQLKAEMEAKKEELKELEMFLQSVPESGMADPDTGEMIMPATFTSSEILSITL